VTDQRLAKRRKAMFDISGLVNLMAAAPLISTIVLVFTEPLSSLKELAAALHAARIPIEEGGGNRTMAVTKIGMFFPPSHQQAAQALLDLAQKFDTIWIDADQTKIPDCSSRRWRKIGCDPVGRLSLSLV